MFGTALFAWKSSSSRAPAANRAIGAQSSGEAPAKPDSAAFYEASLPDLDGRTIAFRDYLGRPTVVNFWATWCAPCKAEMPTLDALAASEKGRMNVIAVSQDLEGRAPVFAFFKETAVKNLVPYTDADNALLTAFNNAIALPTTILYDSDGKEVWRVAGSVEWDEAEMAKLLRAAD